MIESIEWDGKRITKPGCYKNVPMSVYHGDCTDGPSISTTGLKKIFHNSPAVYWDSSYLNPARADDDETSALIFGRAVHHLILGEPHFAQVFAEQPSEYEDEKTGELKKWNGNAGACKRWDAARAKENRYVLTKKEVESIRGVAISLSTHPLVQAGILNGLVERSLFWKDKATGIWLKQRPDVIPSDSGDITDLKTIKDVEWDTLVDSLGKYGYYQQGALSREGLREVLGIEMQTFTLFFVEKDRPYSAWPVIVKDNDLDLGARCNRAALDIMARCLDEKIWPGPAGKDHHVSYIEMAEWRRKRIETKLSIMGYD